LKKNGKSSAPDALKSLIAIRQKIPLSNQQRRPKLMKLASAPNPDVALEEERREARTSMQKGRKSQTFETKNSPVKSTKEVEIDDDVEAVIQLFRRFDWSWKRAAFASQEAWRILKEESSSGEGWKSAPGAPCGRLSWPAAIPLAGDPEIAVHDRLHTR
jgi:hypothetical protein